jgi:hypothetical protein
MQPRETTLGLGDLLAALPANTWTWHILDFYGVGTAPGGQQMAEFEEITRSAPTGQTMSWSELRSFADGIEQTYDCQIVAVAPDGNLTAAEVADEDFQRCEIVIQGVDSTEWCISVAKWVDVGERIIESVKALG